MEQQNERLFSHDDTYQYPLSIYLIVYNQVYLIVIIIPYLGYGFG